LPGPSDRVISAGTGEKNAETGSGRSSGRSGRPGPALARSVPEREARPVPTVAREIGGPTGPEPTPYGDREKNGRCPDF
jgi:hypothetical protein